MFECAFDLVTPARILGLVVVAGVFSGFGAQDMGRKLLEIAAFVNESIGVVDGREFTATGAEEQQIGDEQRTRKQL